jgi:hypothetical protein
MNNRSNKNRLIALLWFVAGGLAIIALSIRYFSDRELTWSLVAGGLFCLIMGASAWRRNTPQSPPSK